MLCYAFRNLNDGEAKHMDTESFDNVLDMLSSILSKGVNRLVKQGLFRSYEQRSNLLSTVRGKINVGQTMRHMHKGSVAVVCDYDEYTDNAFYNQIIKTTMHYLIRSKAIKKEHKNALKDLYMFFKDVDIVEPSSIQWNRLSYCRNSLKYKMVINICHLILNDMLLTEKDGERRLSSYIDDQKMHSLYEKFILEYYKHHYSGLKPSSTTISWNTNDNNDVAMLPNMITDITLTHGDKKLIIDAKYYNNSVAMTQHNKTVFHSNNLYQIYAYVKNMDIYNTGNVNGLLLYARTHHEETYPNHEYNMGGNNIGIKTLNLDTEWDCIESQLNDIADTFIGSNQ